MLHFLPAPIKGSLGILVILLQTIILLPILLVFAFIKLLIPVPFVQRGCTIVLGSIATLWIGINNTLLNTLHRTEWEIHGLETLSREEWYLVVSNHQSWADIPILQYVFNRKIPLVKFFLKKQLIWVPLLGVAWWALDFPFMQRFTREQIAKRPELKGRDLETTRKACEKFRYTPVTVLNFMEGTRFTPQKHARQSSEYQHLLKPRAGGTGFVLGAMGDIINTMLDVSIIYPAGVPTFWDFICGKVRRIIIDIRKVDIPFDFLGMDYTNDEARRQAFQDWVAALWKQKDERIDELLNSAP